MRDEAEADIEMLIDDGGFTRNEAVCLWHIVQAWNAYAALPVQHSSEPREFEAAIHRLQDMMAMRVARRDHPLCWPLKLDG